jgi:hypothetical protein
LTLGLKRYLFVLGRCINPVVLLIYILKEIPGENKYEVFKEGFKKDG